MADPEPVAITRGAAMAGKKRSRDEDEEEDGFSFGERFEKKARPTSGDSNIWPQDSVLNTPTPSSASNMGSQQQAQKPKYDSDDQSSMMSEPGSPRDIEMSSGDDDLVDDTATFSQSPEELHAPSSASKLHSSPWQARMNQANRVPTPIVPPIRPGARPMQARTGPQQHVRSRHPQANLSISSDHLEVPSPIDEDEAQTPPSAAEAAESQLSMLTFNDMEMEPTNTRLPSISVDSSQGLQIDGQAHQDLDMETAVDEFEPMDSNGGASILKVPKQRQRSGALSHGGISPIHGSEFNGPTGAKRGFSMGFRADCEKCRMHVPGHMNHFIT